MTGDAQLQAAIDAALAGQHGTDLSAGVQRLMTAYRSGSYPDRPLLASGLRQLALGALAVGVTFAVGSLIGGGHAV